MLEVALFCGGPKIYGPGLPKPLRPFANGLTLLQAYLVHLSNSHEAPVHLMIEESDVEHYRDVAQQVKHDSVSLSISNNGSTTLEKLEVFLSGERAPNSQILFSYPDIFYFGDLRDFHLSSGVSKVLLGSHKHHVRFPRLSRHPFSNQVRSVGSPNAPESTNPDWVYSGIFTGNTDILKERLESFQLHSTSRGISRSLETDFFSFLANRKELEVIELESPWIQADSERELQFLAKTLSL